MRNDNQLLSVILIISQIFFLVGGQILWKKSIVQVGGFMSSGQTIVSSVLRLVFNPTFLIGSFLYLLATLIWFYLLARFELSFIYPFFSLTLVVLVLGSSYFLGETISFQRWIAVVLISCGVFLITRT